MSETRLTADQLRLLDDILSAPGGPPGGPPGRYDVTERLYRLEAAGLIVQFRDGEGRRRWKLAQPVVDLLRERGGLT
jgi:hypothetical protein